MQSILPLRSKARSSSLRNAAHRVKTAQASLEVDSRVAAAAVVLVAKALPEAVPTSLKETAATSVLVDEAVQVDHPLLVAAEVAKHSRIVQKLCST
jgi:hypothetical protein